MMIGFCLFILLPHIVLKVTKLPRFESHYTFALQVLYIPTLHTRFCRRIRSFQKLPNPKINMRFSVAVSALFVLMGSFVSADLHKEGLCIDKIGGQNVYNADATQKACDAYLNRNTGDEAWDKCPDCKMVMYPTDFMIILVDTNSM